MRKNDSFRPCSCGFAARVAHAEDACRSRLASVSHPYRTRRRASFPAFKLLAIANSERGQPPSDPSSRTATKGPMTQRSTNQVARSALGPAPCHRPRLRVGPKMIAPPSPAWRPRSREGRRFASSIAHGMRFASLLRIQNEKRDPKTA